MSHHEEKDPKRQGANDKNKNKQEELTGKNPTQNPNLNQQNRIPGTREEELKNRDANSVAQARRNEPER